MKVSTHLKANLLLSLILVSLPYAAFSALVGRPSAHPPLSASQGQPPQGLRGFGTVAATLRGGQAPSALRPPRASMLQVDEALAKRVKTVRAKARSLSNLRRVRQEHKQTSKVGACRNKLRWWVKTLKKCTKAFGKDSKWDKTRSNGQCQDAWDDCNTGFYAVCCTQPLGPKNMEAYCANQNMTIDADHNNDGVKDKACQVQGYMRGVRGVMAGIKDTVRLMDTGVIETDLALSFGPGPGPSPGPSLALSVPAPAPAGPEPPPGLLAAPPPAAASVEKGSPRPAPVPAPVPAPAPSPVLLVGTAAHSAMETKCETLTALSRDASERIQAIKLWAESDGIQIDSDSPKKHKGESDVQELEEQIDKDIDSADAESSEAKDPDLVFTVKGVIQMGKKLDALLNSGSFCNKQSHTSSSDDEEEDDDDDLAEDLKKDPTETWDSDDDEDEEEPETLQVNDTAILSLLTWEADMEVAVDKFEKDVHPHGQKWWRYRYEYTVVESFVFATTVMMMYLVMWLLHGVSFLKIHRFYKTGIVDRLHRYAWAYLVFHAASLMVMVSLAYMLYMPWGKDNIFNWFAKHVHGFVDGRANVPYLGYSWLYMVLDVQLQLFVCFVLYSLFVVMVVSNFKAALQDWKILGEGDTDRVDRDTERVQRPANTRMYATLDAIMKRRVQNTTAYQQMFADLNMRLEACERPRGCDFKLYIYLTDALGKAAEYLVQVSLTSTTFLACSSLVVAMLAHHYQVAFMYFLPGFLALGLALFIASYFVAFRLRTLSDNDNYKTPSNYITVRAYCRTIQIILYCLFFSFSRLLLSYDIFQLYPTVYVSALVSLAVVVLLLFFFAGEVIKAATCALALPPHVQNEQFRKSLEQVVAWHTEAYCYECGVQQFPDYASLSQEWAGKQRVGKPEVPPDSARPFSWRG